MKDIELPYHVYEKLVAIAAREGVTPEQMLGKIIEWSATRHGNS